MSGAAKYALCGGWAIAAVVCTLWVPVLALPVTGSFLLLGPGAALLLVVTVPGRLGKVIVAVAASLAVLTLLSMATILLGVWTGWRVVMLESALVVLGLGIAVLGRPELVEGRTPDVA